MIYLFDGSESGFLTAFVRGFNDKNALLVSNKKTVQLPLGMPTIVVDTDVKISEKARARLTLFDCHACKDLELLLRSGEPDSEQAAFLYLRFLAQRKIPVRNVLTEPCVFDAFERIKRIRLEIHRFHGFIRFMECESGALYAPFAPDHDICELLLPHFRARFSNFPFVLHDVVRNKAAVYDGKNAFLAPLDKAEVLLAADEEEWQGLFKKYYHAVNIPSRERLKQMRGYLPARYEKFMPERH